MVTSGSTCERVTTKAECEEAARQLGLSNTTAEEETVDDYPPYCYFTGGEWEVWLWFNKNGSSTSQCSSDEVCICKGEVNCY